MEDPAGLNVPDNAVYQQLLENLPRETPALQNLVIQNLIQIQQQTNENQEFQRMIQDLESQNEELTTKN